MERLKEIPEKQSADPRLSGIFYALLLAALVTFSLLYSLSNTQKVLSVIPDDAAYYFKVAENFAGGRGLTFDGINRTNGFQPLWQYLLIAIYSIYQGTPELMIRVSLILQLLILLVSAKLLHSFLSERFGTESALVSGVLFIFLVFIPSANGMETALLVAVLSVLLVYAWRAFVPSQQSGAKHFLLGLALGLCVLARLDMIFLVCAVYLFCLVAIRRSGIGKNMGLLAWLTAGVAVPVVPYLVYNRVAFGSMMPISGALKTSFPRVVAGSVRLGKFGVPGLLWGLCAFAYLAWAALPVERSKRLNAAGGYFRTAMIILAVSVVLHFVHTLLFMKWAVFRWHFISYALIVSLVAAELVHHVLHQGRLRLARRGYWVLLVLLVCAGVYKTYRNFNRPVYTSWPEATYRAAVWARENTLEADVFAMKDAGNFGLFSRRSVISLDGVVNNTAYQTVLKEKRLNDYLRQHNVKYLVQHAFWNREDINSGRYEVYATAYMSHLHMTESDEVLLERNNEVYRSKPYFDGPYKTVFIIWELR